MYPKPFRNIFALLQQALASFEVRVGCVQSCVTEPFRWMVTRCVNTGFKIWDLGFRAHTRVIWLHDIYVDLPDAYSTHLIATHLGDV